MFTGFALQHLVRKKIFYPTHSNLIATAAGVPAAAVNVNAIYVTAPASLNCKA